MQELYKTESHTQQAPGARLHFFRCSFGHRSLPASAVLDEANLLGLLTELLALHHDTVPRIMDLILEKSEVVTEASHSMGNKANRTNLEIKTNLYNLHNL